MRRTYYRIVLTVVLAGFLAGKTVIFPAYGMVGDGDMSELSTGEDGKEDASLSPDGEGSRGEAPENSHGENGEGDTPPSTLEIILKQIISNPSTILLPPYCF